MYFQTTPEGADKSEIVIIFLIISNLLSPIITYLVGRRGSFASAHDTETKTNFLKLDKVVELMDKVEKAQEKYLELRDHSSRIENRMRLLGEAWREYRDEVVEVFAMIEDLAICDTRFTHILTRISKLKNETLEVDYDNESPYTLLNLSGAPDKN